MRKNIMYQKLTRKFFETMFELKKDHIAPVLARFNTDADGLKEALWTEFDIPGMEVRVANTAFDWVIECCERENDLQESLVKEIRKCILHSGIFYTNVAPNVVHPKYYDPKSDPRFADQGENV